MSGDALALLASLVLSDGARWGDRAEPWQWEDARAVLTGERRLSYLTRPRGASKTTDLAGIVVAALVEQLPEVSRSYAAASDREQAQLLVDAMAGFVARTSGLSASLRVDTWRALSVRSGATLDVLASESSGAFGKLPHLLVVDELAQWPSTREPWAFFDALFSSLPKVAASRFVVLTTAGDPAHPAGRLLERARTSSSWYVHEVEGPCPWISEEDLEEQRAQLTESQYARLHLNRWCASEDRLVDPAALRECVTLDGPLEPVSGWRYVVGVDLGLKSDRSVVAVCHGEPVVDERGRRQRVVLDRLLRWQGSRDEPVELADVEAAVLEAVRRYNRAKVRLDPWQAVGLAQRLRARGVQVEEFSFTQSSTGRLASVLYRLLRDRLLALPPDDVLIDELVHVRLRETAPGVVRLDHDSGRHDDQAVALALAASWIVERPESRPARSHGRQLLRSSARAGRAGGQYVPPHGGPGLLEPFRPDGGAA